MSVENLLKNRQIFDGIKLLFLQTKWCEENELTARIFSGFSNQQVHTDGPIYMIL